MTSAPACLTEDIFRELGHGDGTSASGQRPSLAKLGANWLIDGAGLPDFCGLNEGGEEGAGQGADGVGALGVPLDGDYEMIGRIELDSFDDAVAGRDGGDAEVVADFVNGLMMAGVHEGLRVRPTELRASRDFSGLRFALFQVPSQGPSECS